MINLEPCGFIFGGSGLKKRSGGWWWYGYGCYSTNRCSGVSCPRGLGVRPVAVEMMVYMVDAEPDPACPARAFEVLPYVTGVDAYGLTC